MTKEVQQVGGTRETQDLLTGVARQITVDTSNWELRLHDGVTPGGYRILNLDQLLNVFQLKSDELSGFSFDPQAVGFLTRLAPQDYRLRKLVVNLDGLEITNDDGTAGNPLIALKSSILGTRTFVDGIVADVVGDTAGQHIGPVIGNVTGNVTGNLTGNSVGAHIGSVVGDVDVRGETLLLDNDQIALAKVNQASLLAYVKANAFKPGMIMQWFGIAANVEAGWFICDGTNGTPDLRNRFIYGAGADGSVGATGGTTLHTHTAASDLAGSHAHGITVDDHILTIAQMPNHQHANGICDAGTAMFNHGSLPASPTTADSVDNNAANGVNEGYTDLVGGGLGHNHTATAAANGSHNHGVTVDNASLLPPYAGLYFIMKGP